MEGVSDAPVIAQVMIVFVLAMGLFFAVVKLQRDAAGSYTKASP